MKNKIKKYFVYDILESGIRPGKFIREHVGEVYASNEKAALHIARKEFSSTATVSTKYPSVEEYYEQEVRPRGRFESVETNWLEF
jgi:hypothetical protein